MNQQDVNLPAYAKAFELNQIETEQVNRIVYRAFESLMRMRYAYKSQIKQSVFHAAHYEKDEVSPGVIEAACNEVRKAMQI